MEGYFGIVDLELFAKVEGGSIIKVISSHISGRLSFKLSFFEDVPCRDGHFLEQTGQLKWAFGPAVYLERCDLQMKVVHRLKLNSYNVRI